MSKEPIKTTNVKNVKLAHLEKSVYASRHTGINYLSVLDEDDPDVTPD